ncbi:DUF2158 domain-containing protein [Morganella morganii]|uniref:YodC family protein n=1 Tax=Morganella morganii TaxID=582 RepID=UPI000907CD49|nr:DUF2158 domain-containing protein [Morganella morganii]AUU01865.1 DUF2158 domain-containing protein [Morganella morganii]EHZ6677753.1 DUF2158 domain-containing protein [Morganella morganii]EKU8060759.1 DUF2158 domain-containing protein [Morganella morganii]ELB1286929.1 DUF2158 domain-containing protein [Morganella morganii]MBC3977939.1 DUF2158 domain-containing protein [Morganella morganii]
MAKAKYKTGDKVQLNSGGPVMTVQSASTYSSYEDSGKAGQFSGYYTCQWFAGKKLDKGSFPEESLDKAPD